MSSFQCSLGLSPSIGWNQDLCLQKYIHWVDKWSFPMSTTSSVIAFYQNNNTMISSLHLFGSRSSNNPKNKSYFALKTVICLDTYHQPTFCFLIWCKNLVSKLPWLFTQAMQSLWWPTLRNIYTKYNSQILEGCQVSNALWDWARQ